MDFYKSIRHWLLVGIISAITVSMGVASADTGKHKISMKRANPSEAISRDAILSEVKHQYEGRILSVHSKPAFGDDCHHVQVLTVEGELLTVEVACTQ